MIMPHKVSNAGDYDLVLIVAGGKDGYVDRDGHLVDPADAERRPSLFWCSVSVH